MTSSSLLFDLDCGILLHPSSLPNDYGIGDFGPSTLQWIEMLADCGQSLWQILPLNPAGYGDSPYQSLSAFAANPAFISPESVYDLGLITKKELAKFEVCPEKSVDYAKVYANKRKLILKAAQRFFEKSESDPLRKEYEDFLKREAEWIEAYALFSALKDRFDGKAWTQWPAAYRDRDPKALDAVSHELAEGIQRVKLEQFLLCMQWDNIRKLAREKGIRIIGDLPIFVAHDSVDVWCRRELFRLEPDGMPSVVAGVPPDYFSKTGQLWGNPLYNWGRHQEDGYRWWRKRLAQILNWVDIVRIDHFRGFAACWEVPGNAETARNGRWVAAPGGELFERFVEDWGMPLPVIAEDLGVITPDVVELRDRFNLPGIRIVQFAFGTDPMKSTFLPESYCRNSVAYTGTHDNDTVVGWFNSIAGEGSTRSAADIEAERTETLSYLGTDGSDIHFDFIQKLYASECGAALVPMQDVLGLGSEARMNTPGCPSGSWRWRLTSFEAIRPAMTRIQKLTTKTRRRTDSVTLPAMAS